MYLLTSEGTIHGLFTTSEKAQTAKSTLVEKEIADWLTHSYGKDEILAEATDDERSKYQKGLLKITDFSCYSHFHTLWEDCFYITPIKPNEIQEINLI